MSGICEGRVAIVTGAGRGIGREHALAFAAAGAAVVVNDLEGDQGPAGEVAAEIRAAGGRAVAHGANVADWDQTGDLVATAIREFGDLHVVVNNAGNLRDRMFVSMSVEDWDAVMAVHLRGHFCTARHAVTYWRNKAKEGRAPEGRIINTSSAAGLQGSVAQCNYGAAKAGIAAMTLIQAAELGRYGITSNAIAPVARTRMTEELFKDMMSTDEGATFDEWDPANISPLVVWLGSAESGDVSGRVFEVCGDWIAPADGWRTGPKASNGGRRWDPAQVGPALREVLGTMEPPQKVYGT